MVWLPTYMQHKSGFTAQTFAMHKRSPILLPALYWPWQGTSAGQALQIKECVHDWFQDKFNFPCSEMVPVSEILFPQLHSKYNQSKLLRVMAQKPQF